MYSYYEIKTIKIKIHHSDYLVYSYGLVFFKLYGFIVFWYFEKVVQSRLVMKSHQKTTKLKKNVF